MSNVLRPPFEYQDCTGHVIDVEDSFTPVVACKAEFPVELVTFIGFRLANSYS
jgi:hypothetical protein